MACFVSVLDSTHWKLSSMADDDHPVFTDNVTVLLIAMGSAAFVVTMYHLIAVCLCSQQFTDQNPEQPPPPHRHLLPGTPQTPSMLETSVARLIPAYKYEKKIDVAGEDGTCAVCLGDFEEGEELRTLPECMHSFHVPCIDTWLYSHSSCPICRADATPSPAALHRGPDFVPGESDGDHRIDVVQNSMVQSGLVGR